MHILTLKPTLRSLAFAAFTEESDEPVVESALVLNQFDRSEKLFPNRVFDHVKDALRGADLPPPDVIGVRALFGGERFPRPVFVTDAVLEDLESLAPQAPLHVPSLMELVRSTGGLDAIVYSGRYAASGTSLPAWLSQRLARVTRSEIPHLIHSRTLFQHLCDIVRVLMLEGSACCTAAS